MAKTLATIQKQIDALQKQADALKAKEMVGVVERIKSAIEFYGLTPDDLFSPTQPSTIKRLGRPPKASIKKVSVAKYADDAGHSWTGRGKRPRWYLEALESGKTPEELEVTA